MSTAARMKGRELKRRSKRLSIALAFVLIAGVSDSRADDVPIAEGPVDAGTVAQSSRICDENHPSQSEAVKTLASSFEECAAGAFTSMESALGTWSAQPGHAEIDSQHHHTGRQCLHILGGERHRVELRLGKAVAPGTQLHFHAERWTRRDPFFFCVEGYSDGNWSEIYNGDQEVVIGSFRNYSSIAVIPASVTQLRFTCTSPAGSGLLLDDVRLAPAIPQRIVRVRVDAPAFPALVRTVISPIQRMTVEVNGSLTPLAVTAVSVADSSADLLHLCAGEPLRNGAVVASRVGILQSAGVGDLVPDRPVVLQPGSNEFWIATRLGAGVDIDDRMGVRIASVTFSDGSSREFTRDSVALQRIGVAVRQRNEDGVHTCRIPGLATTNAGSLIGVYDVRRQSGGDLPGDIDVGMSRSTDGGRTWQPMRIIMDMGNDPAWHHDGIGDPAILVDQQTGAIWVAATWSHGNRSWVGSGPGMTPDETGQLMLVHSDDDGVTWSQPVNITSQVKKPEWCFLLQGPGKGITMRDGTLVFAAQFQDSPENKRLPRSTILFSRDRGTTWQIGSGAFDDTTEAQVVELEPGVLMLNCRYNREATRIVMITHDMGKTWTEHPSSRQALIEPGACMASLINVDCELRQKGAGWLLFSNPDSAQARERITIKASPDGGFSWPGNNRVLLDSGRSAGYSCMTMIDNKTVGILYEGSQAQMTFQRIPLTDITGQH